jgi:UDP-N-acetylbacillosamine N-acetyltransferase
MQRIVIFGAGGLAKGYAQTLRRLAAHWRLEGFIDDVNPARAGEAFGGAAVLGGRAALAAARERGVDALVLAIGSGAARLALAAELAAQGWRFPTLIDPHAIVSDDAQLGEGCYVAPGTIVQPGVNVGAQTLLNLQSTLSHDCQVGAGSHVSVRASLAGHVVAGREVWLGIGSVVREGIRIGDGTLVGAGALVVKDLPAGVVAYGQPARVVRAVGS